MSESRKAKFLLNAQEKFGDQYDYSGIEYVNGSVPIRFTCRGCGGELILTPAKHLQGQRCNVCHPPKTSRKTTEWFLERVGEHHSGYDYDYSKVNYIDSKTKVEIFCRTHQQTFFTPPQDFLMGKNRCRECGEEARLKKRRLSFEEWLPRAQAVHGNRYEYDPGSWQGLHKQVRLRCPEHGWFSIDASNHVSGGATCMPCSRVVGAVNRMLSPEEFLAKAKEVHGDTYTYPDLQNRSGQYVSICCPRHGIFTQLRGSHLGGHGCATCGSGRISTGQQEIFDFLQECAGQPVSLEHRMASGAYLDIFLPEAMLGIEYNGLYFHSEPSKLSDSKPIGQRNYKYHLEKTLKAQAEGISLIHIWEDEWLTKPDIVKKMILHRLGRGAGNRIFARKTLVAELSQSDAMEFFNSHHLQGLKRPCSRMLGLTDVTSGELVAAIALTEFETYAEIVRFATSRPVVGAFSKLVRHYLSLAPSNIAELITFSDTRLSEGTLYSKTGFVRMGGVEVSYDYINGRERRHKRAFQRSALEKDFPKFDPSLSERDNCELNGWFRLWDCGKVKWGFKR